MILRSASVRPPPASASLMVPFSLSLRPTRPTRCSHPEKRQGQSSTIPSSGQGIRCGLAIALRCRATDLCRLARSLWRLTLLP